MGVMWGAAGTMIRKDVFFDYATKILPRPPLHLWVDFQVGMVPPDRASGFTRGLTDVGHHELEAVDAPKAPSELQDLFENIAGYLLENGPVIGDGDTVGESDQERIKVRLVPSHFGIEGNVMRLKFEPSTA